MCNAAFLAKSDSSICFVCWWVGLVVIVIGGAVYVVFRRSSLFGIVGSIAYTVWLGLFYIAELLQKDVVTIIFLLICCEAFCLSIFCFVEL